MHRTNVVKSSSVVPKAHVTFRCNSRIGRDGITPLLDVTIATQFGSELSGVTKIGVIDAGFVPVERLLGQSDVPRECPSDEVELLSLAICHKTPP